MRFAGALPEAGALALLSFGCQYSGKVDKDHRICVLLDVDARLHRERKFHTGRSVRAELKQPRVEWQHRLIHKIGHLVEDNIEGWEQLDAHDAVKRLQRESGTCCEEIEIDVPGVVRLMVKQAESLSFDEMEQDRFQLLFDGITEHIERRYAHVMLDEVRAEFWQGAGQNRRAA